MWILSASGSRSTAAITDAVRQIEDELSSETASLEQQKQGAAAGFAAAPCKVIWKYLQSKMENEAIIGNFRVSLCFLYVSVTPPQIP